ncbi:adhesion G protein-coupled receptor F5-like isoform X1 [Anguilla anguilla]|uniref:adhesion G protein-coupled receptor F5-like isoform X1 n=1 Tax=Anguilla anguilla TaxID=7936 RepID=UPI0015B01914|nr:adhesion G protein-coupled receptor F5-like isoform X1 [Anguilla anguilla]XP_035279148.1 adhesion G protein-coupled receptor F5-like isoform X1 [Anguilla anguilla]
MAILTVLSLTVLLVIGNILGTEAEGLLNTADNSFPVAFPTASLVLVQFQEKGNGTTPTIPPNTTLAQLPSEYIIEIEVNVSDPAVLNELQCLLQKVSFPFQVNTRINITHVNLTTVCNISECTIPSKGPFCPASTTPTIPPTTTLDTTSTKPPTTTLGTTSSFTVSTTQLPSEYIIEIEVNVSDPAVLNELQCLLQKVSFPFQVNTRINITHVNLTTVCNISECTIPSKGPFCPASTTPTIPPTTTLDTTSTKPPTNTPGTTPSYNVSTDTTSTKPPTKTPDTTSTKPPTKIPAPVNVGMPTTTAKKATPTSVGMPTTTAKAKFDLHMSFKIIGQTYNPRLNDTSSQEYIQLEKIVKNAIDEIFRMTVKGYIGVSDIRFSSGSVITTYIIGTNKVNSSEIQKANEEVVSTLQSYNVDNTSFTAALIENTFENLNMVFYGDNMSLNCNPTVDKEGNKVTWKLNGMNITSASKYAINEMTSNLIVKSILISDSGTYECSVQIGVVQFIRKKYIAVQPTPAVIVENQVSYSRCNQKVELKCCGRAPNFSLQWIENSQQLTSCNDIISCKDNCTTIDVTCQNEGEIKTFICKMTFEKKELTKEATVHFIKNGVIFTCNDSVYGPGTENDIAVVGCVNETEGSRAAQCKSSKWTFVNNTCLSPAIKELQLKSQVLDKDIPGFVQELYQVNMKLIDDVVISTANILTDVDILQNIIVAINKNGTRFNESVIQNFLNTVDILVSEETTLTWNILNNNTNTNGTGSKLLNTVEEIVKVISNPSTNISTSTLQLNKAIYSEDYNISYFNSTDNVMVFQSMPSSRSEITTVRFLTLDIVLPPRNLTSSNNTINGAVLLAYTNSTVAKVTLTFKIRNRTLGNPQCVFWNFTETAWDSSGCEVQPGGNESITCVCNHLTSFSILMSPFIPEAFRRILDFITYIGVAISMGSLVLCLIIEAIVWTAVTRNNISHMRHVTIVNIAVSLLIANIWFIIGAAISNVKTPVGPCSAATFFIHFFYLALFFWMLISGVLLFYHMVMVFSHMSKRVMMAISFTVGYGAPLIIAVVTVAVTAPQNGYFRPDDACWLNWFQTKALLAFVIPALAIVAINFIILIVVLYKLIRRGTGENQTDERNAVVVIARCIAVLTPFFGLTWGFGLGIMIEPQNIGLHIVFTVLNSLQGFFVLVFGILLDSRIRAALAGRFSFIHTSSNRTRSTSGGPSSSSGLGLFQRRGRRDAYHVSEAATSSQSNAASDSFLNT